MDEIAALKAIPLFGGLDDQEIAALRAVMESQQFLPGQVIIREGDEGKHFYIIRGGRVQYLGTDATGQELLLGEGEAGGFFGELSMLTGEPRLVRVRAADGVSTLSLNRDQFHDFLIKHPHAAIDVLTAISHRLYTTDKLLRQSTGRNVNQEMEEKLTVGQRVADAIAEFTGSIPFLVLNAVWFGGWILWNQRWTPYWAEHLAFDPFPFGLLTMIVSLEAIFLSIFVLVSQNRQTLKDRLAADIDHQVNVRAEIKTGQIMARMDDLEHQLHTLHAEQLRCLQSPGQAGNGSASRGTVAAG